MYVTHSPLSFEVANPDLFGKGMLDEATAEYSWGDDSRAGQHAKWNFYAKFVIRDSRNF